jgi:hypothetical protein
LTWLDDTKLLLGSREELSRIKHRYSTMIGELLQSSLNRQTEVTRSNIETMAALSQPTREVFIRDDDPGLPMDSLLVIF